jgi:hypothetical protein
MNISEGRTEGITWGAGLMFLTNFHTAHKFAK